MAKAASKQHVRGKMDIQEQTATFELFNTMTKWGSLFVGTLVLFLTLWFCTPAGFGGAFITGAVVAIIGVLLLRERPSAEAH